MDDIRQDAIWTLPVGAIFEEDGLVSFRVWAPRCNQISLRLYHDSEAEIPFFEAQMEPVERGFFILSGVSCDVGMQYCYLLDGGKERPDPVSRLLPDGVHGRTTLLSEDTFQWQDRFWQGIPFAEYIMYELHVGTFTEQGDFAGVCDKLDYLVDLGVTVIELMPVAQFPGKRNWGYDGANLFAVQNSYGGPDELKKLVNECHKRGLAVCLDLVYNHLGPEGNYLHDFAPYFTDRYHTPWGEAFNYDGPESDQVREYIINNALYWVYEYHIDALRLDAVQAIYDFSACHILAEIKQRVEALALQLDRKVVVIAESDLNDKRIVDDSAAGGYALDGQWSDDFHHAMHSVLTGEQSGYYCDFASFDSLPTALEQAFVYDGRYSYYRSRRHGNSPLGVAPERFIIALQNHDQVGNRAFGERLSELVSFEALKSAAFILLLSPYTPLLFMGQEFCSDSPFLYFIDHQDDALLKAVREGRRKEFAAFGWRNIPDPSAKETYERSRVVWAQREDGEHAYMLALYRALLRERRSMGMCRCHTFADISLNYDETAKWLMFNLRIPRRKPILVVANFSEQSVTIPVGSVGASGLVLRAHSAEERFGGGIAPEVDQEGLRIELAGYSAALFVEKK